MRGGPPGPPRCVPGQVASPADSRLARPMTLYAAIAAGVFGLVLGSFFNVVIHRLPRGQSLVTPGSRCPACGAEIKPYDNVPVVSWLVLRGRCRSCRAPISARYPLVETLTGALFAAV